MKPFNPGFLTSFLIGLPVSLYFIRDGFAWLLPSRTHRTIVALLLAVGPGTAAVYGGLYHVELAAVFLGGLFVLESGPWWRRAMGGAAIVVAGLSTHALDGYLAGMGDLPRNFLGRVVLAPVLGSTLTEKLLWGNPVGFAAVSLVAIVFFAFLFSRFPRERRAFAALLLLCLLAAPAAGPYLGKLEWNSSSAFLVGEFSLLAWACLFFRGLKETAVVIYFAAVSVVGLYLLALHNVVQLMA